MIELIDWNDKEISYKHSGVSKKIDDPVRVMGILNDAEKRCDRQSVPMREAITLELY